MSGRNQIDKNIELSIINNTHGEFIYKNGLFEFSIDAQGEESYLTIGDLKPMVSRHRELFNAGKLLIGDVDDDVVTVADVYKAIRLDKFVSAYNKLIPSIDFAPNVDEIEFFVIESSSEDFKDAVYKKNQLHQMVIETAVDLQKQGRLSDYEKMEILAKAVNASSGEFWEDIRSSASEE